MLSELSLQQLDLPAQRGLRQIKHIRSAGKTALFGNHDEILKLFEIHVAMIYVFSISEVARPVLMIHMLSRIMTVIRQSQGTMSNETSGEQSRDCDRSRQCRARVGQRPGNCLAVCLRGGACVCRG